MAIDDNYIVVQGWMVKDLKLKGNKLLTFALIYGFSQDGESKFKGSANYIAEWLNTSRRTVVDVLASLVKDGLIEKEENFINKVQHNYYRISSQGVKKLHRGCEETSQGCEKTSHSNIDNNIEDNIKKEINKERKFVVPSVEEVEEYCKERKNGIDAQQWHDFYSSKGWRIGKEPMKDWKAAVRTWEAKRKEEQKKPRERDYSGIHL